MNCEIKKNWIAAQDKINLDEKIKFFKTHQGNFKIGNDHFTNNQNTQAVIYIVRDPRDVILSRKKSDWGKKYPILWHIVEYKHQFLKAQNFSTNNKQFFQIKYEDLLVYPEETLKTLCNFLQVDFDPSMLNHHQHKNNLFSEKETTWKQNVKKPILQDNFNKWKKTIEPSTLKLIENVLWGLDIFKIYKPSFTHQPSLGIIDKMFLSFYLWYINRKDCKKYKL